MKKLKMAIAALTLTMMVVISGCDDLGTIMISDIGVDNPDYESGTYNGIPYVDLGLPSGTLWATCNVGAAEMAHSNPGYYVAWGEMATKDHIYYDLDTDTITGVFTSDNYKYGRPNELTKYCYDYPDAPWLHNGLNGYVDELRELEPDDDLATALWGEGWVTPTPEQFQELMDNTTHKWIEHTNAIEGVTPSDSQYWTYYSNGYRYISGMRFTGKNGKKLFLPAGSLCDEYTPLLQVSKFEYVLHPQYYRKVGDYWTRSLVCSSSYDESIHKGGPNSAHSFHFYEDDHGEMCVSWDLRYLGLNVRAVRKQ